MLENYTIKEDRVAIMLDNYVRKLMEYPRVDRQQLVRVYFDSWGDFCAVESTSYNWCFMSNRHKVSDITQSKKDPVEVPLNQFVEWVQHIAVPF